MNVFILSPGRTATTSLAEALATLPGYTVAHESQVQLLGSDRIDFPPNHIECDNRLVWFLPRLTARYADTGSILVIVHRPHQQIASSYAKRWYKTNIMKAYAQGILLRPFSGNDESVALDYVELVYDQIDFARGHWPNVVDLDLSAPEGGLQELLTLIDRESHLSKVLDALMSTHANLNSLSIRDRLSVVRYALTNLAWDLRQCWR